GRYGCRRPDRRGVPPFARGWLDDRRRRRAVNVSDAATVPARPEAESSGFLDKIEAVGNKVPHPVIMFLYLIAGVAILSVILSALDVSVTEEVVTPVPREQLQDLQGQLGGTVVAWDIATGTEAELPDYTTAEVTYPVKSLLAIDGLRY